MMLKPWYVKGRERNSQTTYPPVLGRVCLDLLCISLPASLLRSRVRHSSTGMICTEQLEIPKLDFFPD